MKDRPILFSSPMIRAIIREIEHPGTGKTMTRRIIKAQPSEKNFELRGVGPGLAMPGDTCWPLGPGLNVVSNRFQGKEPHPDYVEAWVKHKPGDALWVRETWRPIHSGDPSRGAQYRADHPDSWRDQTVWKPGIHMNRWASRLTLEVTAVKVERLQDISEADAIAEGVYRVDPTPEEIANGDCTADDFVWMAPGTRQGFGPRPDAEKWGPDPVFAYRCIWETIHGKGAWAVNHWVTAITFKPYMANIDKHLERSAA